MSRKLDAAIADAQGYEVVYAKTYERGEIRENRNMPGLKIYDDCRMGCPCYSSDACAMLELDAHMRARGFVSWVSSHIIGGQHKFAAEYFDPDNAPGDYRERMARANTEPLARALAAYKALTGKDWKE